MLTQHSFSFYRQKDRGLSRPNDFGGHEYWVTAHALPYPPSLDHLRHITMERVRGHVLHRRDAGI